MKIAPEDLEESVNRALGQTYLNGDYVASVEREDFYKYVRIFDKTPYDATALYQAKSLNEDWS